MGAYNWWTFNLSGILLTFRILRYINLVQKNTLFPIQLIWHLEIRIHLLCLYRKQLVFNIAYFSSQFWFQEGTWNLLCFLSNVCTSIDKLLIVFSFLTFPAPSPFHPILVLNLKPGPKTTWLIIQLMLNWCQLHTPTRNIPNFTLLGCSLYIVQCHS